MKLTLVLIPLLAFVGHAARATEPPDLERQALGLIKIRCVKCHGPAKREGELDLSHVEGMARGGNSGRAVVPGDLAASLLWRRVAADEMPEDEPLSGLEKVILKRWIEAGAKGLPSNAQAKADHWAFRRLQPTAPPDVGDTTRAIGPIDRHVQARLEEVKLTLGQPTDRGRLLRRLSFDLCGLPPRHEELATGATDVSPDAHERAVDRMLASPHYGERFGRHWLDAAGYADSNGYFFADTDRPLAYKYRDYVIRSLNADKPFDRFVREQLAGDELFPAGGPPSRDRIDGLIATHFLRNGPDGTGESDGNPDEVLADKYFVLEASLQIIGSSLLGMTVQCARCHDHKFEPLSQRDYYQLQAIIYPAFNPERWKKPGERVFDVSTKIAGVRDQSADPPEVWLLERGGYRARKQKVDAAPPTELARDGHNLRIDAAAAGLNNSTGRRMAFARWLTAPGSRSAALLARVTVNRLWQNHFGTGIVATADNLGYSGAPPTHPALFEYLAGELVRSGWSVKHVQRLILSSAVYRQTSRTHAAGTKADPENRLLWRFPLLRLDADSLRDAMLAAAGELDERLEGPYVPTKQTSLGEVIVEESTPAARRRSVYLQQRRMQVPSMLAVFDAPLVVYNCTRRNSTTIPLQSLSLLNSQFVRTRAKSLANHVRREASNPHAAVTNLFMLTASRPPTSVERAAAELFLRQQPEHYAGHSDATDAAWIDLCQMVLSSNAFLYVE
jgi:hypothetical protein